MQAIASNADSSLALRGVCKVLGCRLVSYSTLARCSPERRMQDRWYFTLALSPRRLSSRLRRRRGQRVALLAQLADDGRERRRIDLRSARVLVCRASRARAAGRTPWSQRRVRTSSAGRPRSASSRSLISCTAAWGMSVERHPFVRAEAGTHHREWLLGGLRLLRVAWRIFAWCSRGVSDELSSRFSKQC